MIKLTTRKLQVVSLCLCLMMVVLPGCSKGGGGATTEAGPGAITKAESGAGKVAPAKTVVAKTVTDVQFAETAFKALAKGDAVAGSYIDWDSFQAMGQDVGKVYKTMTTDAAKSAFRTSFVSSFSKSFNKSGGNADKLSKWSEKSKDAAKTVVSAEAPNKAHLLMTVTKVGGKQKFSGLALG